MDSLFKIVSSTLNSQQQPSQTYNIGHRCVKVDSKISEGGYAYVYKVIDQNTFT
jgi:hypothetical protein